MPPHQPNGSYPRLNASMLQSGKYREMIVCLVGKLADHDNDGGMAGSGVKFQCADGGVVRLELEHCENTSVSPDSVIEIVGQVSAEDEVATFVMRELSPDTNLDLYNRMILVQHSPKFAHYFEPFSSVSE